MVINTMRYFKLLSIIALIAGLNACEKYIPYDDIAPNPLMVVNGIQQVGQPAKLIVEKSSFYLGGTRDLRVKDVTAALFVNGEFKESLHVIDSGVYQTYTDWETGDEVSELQYAFTYCEGTYILCEGDQLRFEVSSPEFEETAMAECSLPAVPNVISFDTLKVEHYADNENLANYSFALTIDDPAGANYYNFYPQQGLSAFTSSDPVFSDFMNVLDIEDMFGSESEYYGSGPYNVFNDQYFDGKQYSVEMKMSYWIDGNYIYEPFVVEVTCVDAGLYQYLKSYNTYSYVDGGLLELVTEPVQVYSNVRNGVGLVCAQSAPITLSIDLTEN